MSKFDEGNTKGKGRPKGSKNRTSEALRLAIFNILEGQEDKVKEALCQLSTQSPARYLDAVVKLMEFAVPKLQRTESETKGSIVVDGNFAILANLTPEERRARILTINELMYNEKESE